MKNKLMAFMAALVMLGTIFSPIAEAKGGGSSRSSSSSSSRSSGGWSSPKSSSSPKSGSGGWGSPSKSSAPSNKATKQSTSKSSGYSKPESKVERARYENAVKSGKAFNTKEQATADFKSKNAGKYSSTFKSEPSSRPDYIPRRTSYNGREVDVEYNAGRGGYGYWGGGGPGLGTFIMYDALSDAVMMNTLMSHQGYHYGAVPPKPFNPIGILWVFLSIVGVAGLAFALYAIFGR